MSVVTKGARKYSWTRDGGSTPLTDLKREAHRANRRAGNQACHLLAQGADQDDVAFDTTQVDERDIS